MPQAAKLAGTCGLFKKSPISEQSSAPGSEAAQDQKVKFLEKSAPGSEAARDKWLFPNKVNFFGKRSAPGSEAARDKWLVP